MADFIDKVEDLKEYFQKVTGELETQIVNPIEFVTKAYDNFISNPPTDLKDITLDVQLQYDRTLSNPLVLVDRGLFREIIHNLLTNLRHAISPHRNLVTAIIKIDLMEDLHEPYIAVGINCFTRDKKHTYKEQRTTDRLLKEAMPYNIYNIIPDKCKTHSFAPWEESWLFGRL